jgi:hypothetical protein
MDNGGPFLGYIYGKWCQLHLTPQRVYIERADLEILTVRIVGSDVLAEASQSRTSCTICRAQPWQSCPYPDIALDYPHYDLTGPLRYYLLSLLAASQDQLDKPARKTTKFRQPTD